jgi:hypothetical protein
MTNEQIASACLHEQFQKAGNRDRRKEGVNNGYYVNSPRQRKQGPGGTQVAPPGSS